MYRTIVVGHNGTAAADAATTLARRLLAPGGHLVLAAVVRSWETAAIDRLDAIARSLEPSVAVECQVMELPSAADGLALIASARDADLLVLGGTHRGLAGRLTGQTTVQRLLRDVPCALAIANDPVERLQRIAVAHDGTAHSDEAVRLTYAIAAEVGASVVLCRALEPTVPLTPPLGTPYGTYADPTGSAGDLRREQAARRELEELAERAPAGVATECRVVWGEPGHALAQAAVGCDLLVTGSRHHSTLHRALVGSVSATAALEFRPAVLITPRAAQVPATIVETTSSTVVSR